MYFLVGLGEIYILISETEYHPRMVHNLFVK